MKILSDVFFSVADDDGNQLRANLSVGAASGGFAVTIESRSGRKGDVRERNPDYNSAVEIVLRRLAEVSAVVVEAHLASRPALRLPPAQRRLSFRWPLSLRPGMDVRQLRLQLGHAQREVASSPDKEVQTGNAQKRMQLTVSVPGCSSTSQVRHLLETPRRLPPD